LIGRELWLWRLQNGYQPIWVRERETVKVCIAMTEVLVVGTAQPSVAKVIRASRILLGTCAFWLRDEGHNVEVPPDLAARLTPKWMERLQQADSHKHEAEGRPRAIQQIDDRLVRGILADALAVLGVTKGRRDNYLRGPWKARRRVRLTSHFVEFVVACCTSPYDRDAGDYRGNLPRMYARYREWCIRARVEKPLTKKAFASEVSAVGGVTLYHPSAPKGKRPLGFKGIGLRKNM
jgi:hypothetical protein